MRSEAKHNRLHLTPPRWLPDGSTRPQPLLARPTCAAWPLHPMPFRLDEGCHPGDVDQGCFSGDAERVRETCWIALPPLAAAEDQWHASCSPSVSAFEQRDDLASVPSGRGLRDGLQGIRQSQELCGLLVGSDPDDCSVLSGPDAELREVIKAGSHRKRRRWTFGALVGPFRRRGGKGRWTSRTPKGRGTVEFGF